MTLSRRELLAATGTLALGAGLPTRAWGQRVDRGRLAPGGGFGSGVAAGVPSERGALLWTRLADQDPAKSVRVALEVARDRDFRRLVHRETVQAVRWRDHTARLALNSNRLAPGEEYFYRFATRTTSSRVGRFRTLRPPDSNEPVRIGFFSCQRFEHGYFTPQAGLADEDDLDLVISLGDYIYEEDAGVKVPGREDSSGQPNGHVETLAQFRARHRRYRSDAALQEMHARHSFVSIWDDCEVEGNWAGEGPSSGPSPVGPRSIPFADKRRNGFLAYFEWMPVPRSRAERFKVYRRMRLGGAADLLLLDTRQYRDPQPCGDRSFPDVAPCPEAAAPGRKRLGEEQKAWLKRSLEESSATWKILANAQMMMALDLPYGQPIQYDDWSGYAAERRELLEFVRDRRIANVTSIVGDVHCFFAGDLHTTGRIDGTRVGTEFVGASVSHDALVLPALTPDTSALLTERLPLANPHLKFAQFRNHGYVVLEARRDGLSVHFRAARTTAQPRSDIYTLQSFRVKAGVPRVELG